MAIGGEGGWLWIEEARRPEDTIRPLTSGEIQGRSDTQVV